MTREEAAAVVAAAKELWPGQWDITETTFRVWYRVLADCAYQSAVEAMLTLAATRHFYPRPGPADVWQEIHRIDTPDDDEAWEAARGYLSRSYPDLGVYPPVASDRSLPAQAYRLAGGYQTVNDSRYGRRAFMEAWKQITTIEQERTSAALPRQVTRRREIEQ